MYQGPLGYARERLRHLKIVHLLHKRDVPRQGEHRLQMNIFGILDMIVGNTEIGFVCTCKGDKCSFISQNTEKCIKTNVLG